MINLKYIWSKFFKKMRLSALKNCEIDKTSKVESGSNLVNVQMGKYSFCGYNCEMSNVDIGSFCSIANGVIIGGGMHPIHWVSTSPVFYEGRDSVVAKFSEHTREQQKKTIIGHDVWIAQNCIIKQGVKIGNGAVVGMGSIVTKDVKPYSIVVGNPAKLIKMRFSEDVIKSLEETRWWEYNDKDLGFYAQYFKEPELFIGKIKNSRSIVK